MISRDVAHTPLVVMIYRVLLQSSYYAKRGVFVFLLERIPLK